MRRRLKTVLVHLSPQRNMHLLRRWIADSLPEDLISRMDHFALRGRLDQKKLNWWLRLMLRIGAYLSDDPGAKKEEREGFDYMDKASIEPIMNLVRQIRSSDATSFQQADLSP